MFNLQEYHSAVQPPGVVQLSFLPRLIVQLSNLPELIVKLSNLLEYRSAVQPTRVNRSAVQPPGVRRSAFQTLGVFEFIRLLIFLLLQSFFLVIFLFVKIYASVMSIKPHIMCPLCSFFYRYVTLSQEAVKNRDLSWYKRCERDMSSAYFRVISSKSDPIFFEKYIFPSKPEKKITVYILVYDKNSTHIIKYSARRFYKLLLFYTNTNKRDDTIRLM